MKDGDDRRLARQKIRRGRQRIRDAGEADRPGELERFVKLMDSLNAAGWLRRGEAEREKAGAASDAGIDRREDSFETYLNEERAELVTLRDATKATGQATSKAGFVRAQFEILRRMHKARVENLKAPIEDCEDSEPGPGDEDFADYIERVRGDVRRGEGFRFIKGYETAEIAESEIKPGRPRKRASGWERIHEKYIGDLSPLVDELHAIQDGLTTDNPNAVISCTKTRSEIRAEIQRAEREKADVPARLPGDRPEPVPMTNEERHHLLQEQIAFLKLYDRYVPILERAPGERWGRSTAELRASGHGENEGEDGPGSEGER